MNKLDVVYKIMLLNIIKNALKTILFAYMLVALYLHNKPFA